MITNDPLWFKNAIIYEVPVRAFADSNGDGIGDFGGLTEKLDYLQELGVTALWVLPFFPSPLRDDGYDIANYMDVNPIYGTLEDFKTFLEAAHQRGIRVIIELIINHTSDQHPWFQRARRSPKGSPERNFYVWSDTAEEYREARIIFQDFETSNWTWDPVAQAYFWHRFYSHQPDLNYDNPAVQQAVFEVLDFWLSMGVDGLRMDAVPYLYEREGTNCENLPETHAFLKQLRQHVDAHYPNRMLLAEANQWPEDAAAYYGDGDECHMNFHFPLMPRLFMSVRMEDNFPILDILQQTPTIPDNCQWGIFLRNHDELTLEMVTDEDRDYMYRVYAQDPDMRVNLGIRRRLAPLLGNDRRQIELLNSLLLTLGGTPVLYYGDEIGMGDNVYVGDRNGVRTPMQWSADRNAGFSRANPQRLYLPLVTDPEYHYLSVNVEAQRSNPNSLFNAIRRLIATRKRFRALGQGDFQLLHPNNRKVLAFTRTFEGECILIVANLSRFVQMVDLELPGFKGYKPVEIFGRTAFPPIGEAPYFLSLSPYTVYWFQLVPQEVSQCRTPAELPTLTLSRVEALSTLFSQANLREFLEATLPCYLHTFGWFGGRIRPIQSATITDAIALPYKDRQAHIVLLQIDYLEGGSETYQLPLTILSGEEAIQVLAEQPQAAIARLRVPGEDEVQILADGMADRLLLNALLQTISRQQQQRVATGQFVATATDLLPDLGGKPLETSLLRGEHSNTSIIYGDLNMGGANPNQCLILKLFRRVEEGINPDLEMRRFLDHDHRFNNIPSIAGTLEFQRSNGAQKPTSDAITLGILQEFIPDARNTWDYTLDSLRDFFEYVTIHLSELPPPVPVTSGLTDVHGISELVPPRVEPFHGTSLATQGTIAPTQGTILSVMAAYLSNVHLLGQRTAEMHLALASEREHPAFAPEPFTSLYQRSMYQYARELAGRMFLRLRDRLPSLPDALHPLVQQALDRQSACLDQFHHILRQKVNALRIRYHGDYHLGQVLYTGKDFIVLDFEGNIGRPLNERRMKRSPLRDVVSMLQSFHFASQLMLQQEVEEGMGMGDRLEPVQQWATFWTRWVSATFLQSYLHQAGQGQFLPPSSEQIEMLLNHYMLEKTVYDLNYHLLRQPEQLESSLRRLIQLV